MAIDISKLWDFNDPVGSETRFRTALQTAAGSEADELRTQIARAQGLQREFNLAWTTLDGIEHPQGRVSIRVALERGRICNSDKRPADAVPWFLEAVRLATEQGEDALEIDALHMLGIAAPAADRLGWNERAIARAEESDDPAAKRWLGSLLNNTAWTYFDSGRYEEALDLFERAELWHSQSGTVETQRIARWSVARARRALGQNEEALEAQLQLATEIGDAEPDGYVFEEIGECLLSLGKAREAALWFGRAADHLSKDEWFVENEPDRLGRMRELSLDQK